MTLKLALSTLSIAVGLALVGCGGSGSTSNDASTVSTTGELADTQTIVINNGAEPETLDPQKAKGVGESNILRQMLVGLTDSDKDGKTVPGMATEWSSPDNKVWTFKLRDAKWSNGDPVTAHDFVYSFRRLTDPSNTSDYATYLVGLKVLNAEAINAGKAKTETLGVKALDDKTLQITLTEPVPYLPDAMFHSSVMPVHQKSVEAHGDKFTSPGNFVVNGPYNIKDWKINEKIVLERNTAYFDDANTTINEVTFLAIPQATTDVARYKAGEVDITYEELPPEQFEQLKAELGSQVNVQPRLCTYYYEFNHTKPPFNDVRVRKALALAMDRETITDKILRQGQTAAYQYVPTFTQGMKNFTPEWQSWDRDKRIAEAKKLLTEAGYSQSNPLKFELLYNTNENHRTLAVAVASFYKDALGFVDISLANQEWKTYLDNRSKQNFQMARGGWCADYNEPSSFLLTFTSGSGNNNGKYKNAEFDKLLNQTLDANITPEQRGELYRQAEAVLDKDASTIFVYHYTAPRLVKPYVAGFSESDAMNFYHVKDLKILKH
ncbi:ABC transporter substrate-binding protein [Moraxella marmotae]|uniref:ABC transporter substrate-binding protein n=1 Tax=Moraxella marmotae TaxID=3344520 RepID=UPI0035F2C3CF